jgi:hypothetical protein
MEGANMETIQSRRAKRLSEEPPPGVSPDRRRGKQSAPQETPAVNLAAEDDYWREHFSSRYYVEDEFKFEDYAPAYRLGCQARFRFPAREWEEIEPLLKRAWSQAGHLSRLDWDRAQLAARDAWDRCSASPMESTTDES